MLKQCCQGPESKQQIREDFDFQNMQLLDQKFCGRSPLVQLNSQNRLWKTIQHSVPCRCLSMSENQLSYRNLLDETALYVPVVSSARSSVSENAGEQTMHKQHLLNNAHNQNFFARQSFTTSLCFVVFGVRRSISIFDL